MKLDSQIFDASKYRKNELCVVVKVMNLESTKWRFRILAYFLRLVSKFVGIEIVVGAEC